MSQKLSFLDMPAPEGYVPGLGRGAMGFTTRSDVGPGRASFTDDVLKTALGEEGTNNEEADRFKDSENEEGLLSVSGHDAADDEADLIYDQIEERMGERRKEQRLAREKKEKEEFERLNPKISTQFSNLKRALSNISDEQWANLPEVGDLTKRNKRLRQENNEQRYYAVPDSLLISAAEQGQTNTSIDVNEIHGSESDGTFTDFNTISSAKSKFLSLSLGHADGSIGGTESTIDSKGYLTSLENASQFSGSFTDMKRAKELLQSLCKTNPHTPNSWIALARCEEALKQFSKARKVIQQGCDNCPKNEDLWLENMRLNDHKTAKIVVSNAIKNLPNSVKLWMEACRLENDPMSKKVVLRKALEKNPHNVTLWKEAVNLEEDQEDARKLLESAVEFVPLSVELWLALAHVETPEKAKKILNKARKTIKVSYEIWVAAARLEEQTNAKASQIDKIIARGIKELKQEGGTLKRDQWIAEAEKCEEEGAILTSHAIIKASIGLDLDDTDKEARWQEDGQDSAKRGKFETSRAIYQFALDKFPHNIDLWRAYAELEKNNKTKDSLWNVLEKSVVTCPSAEFLWLIYAKEKWLDGDVAGARIILGRAFESNPNNEEIWLAAVKLEHENKEFDMARKLLKRARVEAGTARIWSKSVVLERHQKKYTDALALVTEGLQQYPEYDKLWMQKGQIYIAINKINDAREAFVIGTRSCPKSIPLWLLLSKLEESQNLIIKSRSILDRASLVNDKSTTLWVERIRLEKRSDNLSQAQTLISKALQECPTSGLVWRESILMEPPAKHKLKVREAILACGNDPYLLAIAGKSFWDSGKHAKAQNWFERAIQANTDIGDMWAWLFKFLEGTNKSSEEIDSLVKKCQEADPHHGECWTLVTKNLDNSGKSKGDILRLTAGILL
ncbi:putative mRNA splicing factor [Nadsonia fulvescens var. elongata DSM 6958]|uniref:Putative mRNA splicing factor n=1 Tax=Nadsonia fulvescens var. elongata DSM 6958 TaxID=857566 RepID=A0A1E3PF76_9ASCO|nr:putative mRNA splicing factor [Nadsonia fulvescens var. elongata DSM 6958]